MKILLVQLSDMHCTSGDGALTLKIEKAVDALKIIGKVDGALLVFSGDLAATGVDAEYKVARKLIGKFLHGMSDALNCGFIYSKFVPGNHDISLPDGCRTAEEIATWNKMDHLNDELKQMKPFLRYAVQKHCFQKDSIIDKEIISFGEVRIQVCLLNSAPLL